MLTESDIKDWYEEEITVLAEMIVCHINCGEEWMFKSWLQKCCGIKDYGDFDETCNRLRAKGLVKEAWIGSNFMIALTDFARAPFEWRFGNGGSSTVH